MIDRFFLYMGIRRACTVEIRFLFDTSYFRASKILFPNTNTTMLLGGARQVLISREITLRHKELKNARLTLSCNRGKSYYFFSRSVLHLSNCQNRNWTKCHFSPICFIDIETFCQYNLESLNTAALGRH